MMKLCSLRLRTVEGSCLSVGKSRLEGDVALWLRISKVRKCRKVLNAFIIYFRRFKV